MGSVVVFAFYLGYIFDYDVNSICGVSRNPRMCPIGCLSLNVESIIAGADLFTNKEFFRIWFLGRTHATSLVPS